MRKGFRCFNCGGRNHKKSQCPSPRTQINQPIRNRRYSPPGRPSPPRTPSPPPNPKPQPEGVWWFDHRGMAACEHPAAYQDCISEVCQEYPCLGCKNPNTSAHCSCQHCKIRFHLSCLTPRLALQRLRTPINPKSPGLRSPYEQHSSSCREGFKCNIYPCLGCKDPQHGPLCLCIHCKIRTWLDLITPEEAIRRLLYPEIQTSKESARPRGSPPRGPPRRPPGPGELPKPVFHGKQKNRAFMGMNALNAALGLLFCLLLLSTKAEATLEQIQKPSNKFRKLKNTTFLDVGKLYVESSINTIHIKVSFDDLLAAGDNLEQEWMQATNGKHRKLPLQSTIVNAILNLQTQIGQLQFEFTSGSSKISPINPMENNGFHFLANHLNKHFVNQSKGFNDNQISSRKKRKVNFDVKIDAGQVVQNIFSGINSIFHYKALSALGNDVNHLQSQFQGIQSLVRNVTNNIQYVKHNQESIKYDIEGLQLVMELIYKIDITRQMVAQLVLGIHRLAEGRIDPSLLPLVQANLALQELTSKMQQSGLKPIISHPMELYNLPITYALFKNSIEIFIHVPGVDIRDEGFQLLEFSPMGIIQENQSYLLVKDQAKFIAISEGIESDAKIITLTWEDFNKKCSKVGVQEWACIRPRMVKQVANNCLSSLYFGHGSQPCKTTNIFEAMPKKTLKAGLIEASAISGQFVTFFFTPTEISINCNGIRETHTLFGYQLWPANASRCQIFTPAWDVSAAPRPIFAAEVISKAGPTLPSANPDFALVHSTANATNLQSSVATDDNAKLEWVNMDLNATEHQFSNQFESIQILSISALVFSIASILMASGVTVIFKRNFGFLLSPLTVPLEGITKAIAQQLSNNATTNDGDAATSQESQDQMEMVDVNVQSQDK